MGKLLAVTFGAGFGIIAGAIASFFLATQNTTALERMLGGALAGAFGGVIAGSAGGDLAGAEKDTGRTLLALVVGAGMGALGASQSEMVGMLLRSLNIRIVL